MSYGSAYETSDLRSYTFKARAPRAGRRVALLRCLRPASLPDPFSQRPQRTSASDSRKSRVWLPEGAQCHPRLQREGTCCSASWLLASLRRMLHQPPSKFGKQSTFWTLAMAAAEVSFEEGLIERQVSGETIRATLARLGVRWKRAKRWIESPDPEYERKKGIEIG